MLYCPVIVFRKRGSSSWSVDPWLAHSLRNADAWCISYSLFLCLNLPLWRLIVLGAGPTQVIILGRRRWSRRGWLRCDRRCTSLAVFRGCVCWEGWWRRTITRVEIRWWRIVIRRIRRGERPITAAGLVIIITGHFLLLRSSCRSCCSRRRCCLNFGNYLWLMESRLWSFPPTGRLLSLRFCKLEVKFYPLYTNEGTFKQKKR